MEIPTKRVRILATGAEATINASDFDPALYGEIVDAPAEEAAGDLDGEDALAESDDAEDPEAGKKPRRKGRHR